MAIAAFFILHWQVSVFFQTFFLHRYGAHRQFTLSKGWERFFHLCTYVTQGSSYLSPRAYAILHRMHHAYSDTPKDPHSPLHHAGLVDMMNHTRIRYDDLKARRVIPEARFDGGYPEWGFVDRLGTSWASSVGWGAAYLLYYVHFATRPWMFLLVPFHWFMGPVHGAIVNWCGHRYGYRNYGSADASKNTLVFDVLTMGELFQNNHHKYGMSPRFSARWFEVDPAYQIMRVFHWVGILDLRGAQKMRWTPADAAAEQRAAAPPGAVVVEPALGGE